MTARVGLTAGTYTEEAEQVRFWETLLSRVQSQPGVQVAAVIDSLPGHGSGDGPVSIEGRDYGDASTKPFVNHVMREPSYFETFRIAPIQGRVFDGRDTLDIAAGRRDQREDGARRCLPDESPIGKRVLFDLDEDKTWYTIIGVVPNVVRTSRRARSRGLYISVMQHPQRFMSIAVRGEGDPRGLVGAVRTALGPDRTRTWRSTGCAPSTSRALIKTAGFRIIGTMFAVFAGVALVLAAAGLFGVLAFHVGQRTREIGVRRALGADDGRILRMVMRASGVQILLGVAIGMTLLPLMGRGLGDILGEVSPYDPGIYSMVIGLMIDVAIIATLTPTRRALKVDPAAALRYE